MADQKVVYKGEAQLMRWSDGNTSGPTITLALPNSEDLEHFRGATLKKGGKAGQLYAVMIVELDPDALETEPPKKRQAGPHGQFYAVLHRAGFFYNPKVLAALGTDAEYLDWVKRQPSCVSGQFSEFHENGDKFSIPAHVRRVAAGAGTAIKPPYSAVPLTNDEHQRQHKEGEDVFGGKDFFDQKRGEYVLRWAKSRFYTLLGVESLSDCSPAGFIALCRHLGIAEQLPAPKQREA